MQTSLDRVHARIVHQKTALPAIYGDVDFSITPERFTDDPRESMLGRRAGYGTPPPAHMIERVRAYTMLGDVAADGYAALIPQYGFRRIVDMLKLACDEGLSAVPNAPPELAALLHEMEQQPEWLDMELVRRGAQLDRVSTAVAAPWFIRGAFLATFLNKYSALPMAMTGTLAGKTCARRVNETATFFTVTTLPGALEPRGAGFKAAAMVRLMHSMVRFNILRRVGGWDVPTYGIPIPQVDQMPAGLIGVFLLAYRMVREGRTEFTGDERAQVEFSRYRCYLLGLPEDLLLDTPQGIVDIMNARNATLRHGFDDATCGALIRATLDAYLPPDESPAHRMFDALERRVARIVFIKQFLRGDRKAAAAMGVSVTELDFVLTALVGLWITAQMGAYRLALSAPGLAQRADAHLTHRIKGLLGRYGHAEFTTDVAHYRATVHATA